MVVLVIINGGHGDDGDGVQVSSSGREVSTRVLYDDDDEYDMIYMIITV